MTVSILFGFGGVSRALAEKLLMQGYEVICFSRNKHTLKGVSFRQADILTDDIKPLLIEIFSSRKVDYVINTIGMLHTYQHQPEKSLGEVSDDFLIESVQTNVLTSVHIAQSLARVLTRQSSCKFVSFSARLASIGDNRLGGWYSYRMSKAMLNMFLKNLAIEWQRNFPSVTVVGYHPGTVDTPLSQPFQDRVKPGSLFTSSQAAEYFLSFLKKIDVKDTGRVFDWQGKAIAC